jgi:hypothetical protein
MKRVMKGSGMAKRSLWDELERRVREWLKELDQALAPRQPERARVPVPVRVNPDRRRSR